MPAISLVSGHARLVEPPSRASMWRYGFDTAHDYQDNEGFCGGFFVQWEVNGGKCGLCGDAWDAEFERPADWPLIRARTAYGALTG